MIQSSPNNCSLTLTAVWLAELKTRIHTALRDALLPKLIFGELRVKAAERAIEDATT